MNVKADTGIGEVLAKKLFSITTVPKEVQKKMVRTSIKSARDYHEGRLNMIVEEIDTQIKIAEEFKEIKDNTYYDGAINALKSLKIKIEKEN